MSAVGRALSNTRRRLGAVAWAYGLRLLVAWIVASPIARTLSSSVAAHHPRGDAVLFDAGGLELVESLRLSMGVLSSELRGALLIGGVLGWLLLVPAAGLLSALADPERSGPAEWTRRGVQLLPRFTLGYGSRLFCQGLLIALAGVALWLLEPRLPGSWDERQKDLVLVALAMPVLALVYALGAFEDVLRAELLGAPSVGAALRAALGVARRRSSALLVGAVSASLCSLALPIAVAPLVARIDVSRPETWRLIAVTLLHQAVVFALVALRASWLALVLELRSRE